VLARPMTELMREEEGETPPPSHLGHPLWITKISPPVHPTRVSLTDGQYA